MINCIKFDFAHISCKYFVIRYEAFDFSYFYTYTVPYTHLEVALSL